MPPLPLGKRGVNPQQNQRRLAPYLAPSTNRDTRHSIQSLASQFSQVQPRKGTLGSNQAAGGNITIISSSGATTTTGSGTGTVVTEPYANSSTIGITSLSIDPVNLSDPIAVGINDQRVEVFNPAGTGASYGIVPVPPVASQNPPWYLGSDAAWHPPASGGGTTPTEPFVKFGTADNPNVSSVPVINVPGNFLAQSPAIDGNTFVYYLTITPQSGFRLFADGAACVMVDTLQRAGDFLYVPATGQITLFVAPINHIFADIQ